MKERNKRIAATVTSVLAAASITTGFALGSGSSPSTPTPPAAATPAAAAPAAPAVDPAGDPNAQGPDTGTQAAEPAGAEGVENPAAEVAGSESASEPANERGLEPANSHQDAPGQNVDHQFEGVE